jgi:hypothetical protein
MKEQGYINTAIAKPLTTKVGYRKASISKYSLPFETLYKRGQRDTQFWTVKKYTVFFKSSISRWKGPQCQGILSKNNTVFVKTG